MDGIIWKKLNTGDTVFLMMEINHESKYLGISQVWITGVYNRLGKMREHRW